MSAGPRVCYVNNSSFDLDRINKGDVLVYHDAGPGKVDGEHWDERRIVTAVEPKPSAPTTPTQ